MALQTSTPWIGSLAVQSLRQAHRFHGTPGVLRLLVILDWGFFDANQGWSKAARDQPEQVSRAARRLTGAFSSGGSATRSPRRRAPAMLAGYRGRAPWRS